MSFPFNVTLRSDGTILTASMYNADRQEIPDNMVPENIDDYSTSITQMRTMTDPGEVGSESLATSLAGEIERLRFEIKQIKDRLNGSPVSQWYSNATGDLAIADGGTGASDAATARTNLGLGTIATQNANAVNITGGSISSASISGGSISSASISGGTISSATISNATYNTKIQAKSGAGGAYNPNDCGFVFSSDNDTGMFSASDGKLSFYVNGTEMLKFDVAYPNLGWQLLNGILKFPATQNPSSDPNALDDYEEGSWTPVWQRDGTAPTVNYSQQVGSYVKIGRLVVASGVLLVTVTDQGSGVLYIGGLPFPTGDNQGTGYQGFAGGATGTSTLTLENTAAGQTQAKVIQFTSVYAGDIPIAFRFVFIYHV